MRMLLSLAIVLGMLPGTASADPPEQKATMSSTESLLRVTGGDGSLSSRSLLASLVGSRLLLRDAIARLVPEAAASVRGDAVRVTPLPREDKDWPSGVVEVSLASNDERVPADKLLKSLVEVVTEKLRELEPAGPWAKLVSQLEDEQHKIKATLLATQRELVNRAANRGGAVTAEQNAQLRVQCQSELRDLEVHLLSIAAKRRVLEKQLSDLPGKVKESADSPLVRAAAEGVELAKQKYERLRGANKKAPGAVTSAELQMAETEIRIAQAQLDQVRLEVSGAGGERVSELRQRLEDLEVDQTEINTRLGIVQQRCKVLAEQLPAIDEMILSVKQLEADFDRLTRELGEAKSKAAVQQLAPLQIVVVNVR